MSSQRAVQWETLCVRSGSWSETQQHQTGCVMVKNTDSERQAPLLRSCSSLGKSLTFSVPRFAHLLKADDEYLVNACECDFCYHLCTSEVDSWLLVKLPGLCNWISCVYFFFSFLIKLYYFFFFGKASHCFYCSREWCKKMFNFLWGPFHWNVVVTIFLTPKTFCTGVQPNIVIVSGEQWRDSAVHIHISILKSK